MQHKQKPIGRKNIRLRLIPPQIGQLCIEAVNGEPVKSNTHPVLIVHMSPSGLRICSHLKFPVESHYELRIEMRILQVHLELRGAVEWRTEEENLYEYGVTLLQTEAERLLLSKLLHDYLRSIIPEQERIHQLYSTLLRSVSSDH